MADQPPQLLLEEMAENAGDERLLDELSKKIVDAVLPEQESPVVEVKTTPSEGQPASEPSFVAQLKEKAAEAVDAVKESVIETEKKAEEKGAASHLIVQDLSGLPR